MLHGKVRQSARHEASSDFRQHRNSLGRSVERTPVSHSEYAGKHVSNSVDESNSPFSETGAVAEERPAHAVIDRYGVEWIVSEIDTPQDWARAPRCLLMNSRECVRRLWAYPAHWRLLDAETLLRLGAVEMGR